MKESGTSRRPETRKAVSATAPVLGSSLPFPMATPRLNRAREKRIDYEVVVDCYTSEERAMGWFYYLEEKLSFPFEARCIAARAISPLNMHERVPMVAIAGDLGFRSDIKVHCPRVRCCFLRPPASDMASYDVYYDDNGEGANTMRTTLNIDDRLLSEARHITGLTQSAALVREGLRALIERESARRLARLGGSERQLKPIPRRRSQAA